MNKFVFNTLVLLAPWGLYFLIKRVVFLAFEGLVSILTPDKNLTAKLRAKFDAAYAKDNLEEIIRVEEDAMYARLQELSKPRVSKEARSIHLNHVVEWCAKNNYPGNKRQIDLLIAAIKINQKYPDLLSRLSLHLRDVSNSYNQLGPRKPTAFRQIGNGGKVNRITPGSVSAWLAIILYCTFVFAFDLLDGLHQVVQILFWGTMIFILYLSLGRLLIRSSSLKIISAVILAMMYLSLYSYWNHLKAEADYFSLGNGEPEIQYPTWLFADLISTKGETCGEQLVITANKNFAPFTIDYSNKEIEVFNAECNIVSLINAVPNEDNMSIVYYLRPKNLQVLLGTGTTSLHVKWSDSKTSEPKAEALQINLENLVWYYGRQGWGLIVAGAILASITDFIKLKIRSS